MQPGGSVAKRVRPRPKYKPRRKLGPLPDFALVALRWAVTWAIVGLMVSVFSLVRMTFYFTESSVSLDDGIAYSVPAMIAAAAVAGLALGLIYTGLLAISADWRDSLESNDWKTRLISYVLCGAAAGLIPGFLVGGFTGALFFAVLGGCTALSLTWIEMRRGLI
jgi:MFS family permease